MTPTTRTRMTFEDYLVYDDGTEKRYELEQGKLVEMPPESPLNSRISLFLAVQFAELLSAERICHKDAEIAVSGSQVQVRLPDLMVLSAELTTILESGNRGTITLDMPPPDLIAEVVSPGSTNQNRDYRFKRSEYAARGVAEYWVIAPDDRKITVFTLVDGFYEEAVYGGEQVIPCQVATLQLTAAQIFDRQRHKA